MNKSDSREFAIIMARMASAYLKEIPKLTVEVFFDELSDLPIDRIKMAVRHICRTKKISTLPTIGEIRGFVVKDIEELALEAWHRAIKVVEEVGSYRSVSFDDYVIHSVIENEFGGWERFCSLPRDDEPWDRKRFLQAYYLYHEKKKHSEYLIGIHQRLNQLNGYDERNIVFIGKDKEIKKLKGGK